MNLLKICRAVLYCTMALYGQKTMAQLAELDGSIQITFPIDNAVFQKNSADNAAITFTGQSLKGTFYSESNIDNLYLKVYKYNYVANMPNAGNWTFERNIPVSFEECANCGTDPEYDPKTFFVKDNNTSFSKGWFQVALGYDYNYCGTTVFMKTTPWKKFGVGDVYLVAGQSNASGASRAPIGNDDKELMYFESTGSFFNPNRSPKITDIEVFEGSIINKILTGNRAEIDRPIKGLPYYIIQSNENRPLGLTKFLSGQEGDLNEMGMAPNGYDSWAWQRFSNDLVNYNQYPILTFNVAKPGTEVKYWKDTRFDTHMKKTLQMYGGAFGLKAVLWQQGEHETGVMLSNNFDVTTTNPFDYQNDLNSLINKSRIEGLGSHTIPWLISRTSLITREGLPPYNADKMEDPLAISANSNVNYQIKAKTSNPHNTVAWQNSVINPTNKVYAGPETDAFDYSTRSTWSRLHLDGFESDITGKSGLRQLAESWYSSVSNNAVNNPLEAKTPTKIKLTKSGSNYLLTIHNAALQGEPQITANGTNKFYWVKNENGIASPESTAASFPIPVNSSSTYYITCYYQESLNSPLVPSQPYYVKQSCTGCRVGSPSQGNSKNLTNISSGGGNYSENIDNLKDGAFPIAGQCLSWAFLTFDPLTDEYQINVSTNTTSTSRNGTLTIVEQKSPGTILKSIYIEQNGSTAPLPDVLLTTLTPTSSYIEFGSVNTNGLNAYGDALNINGQPYTQGIGTHANSTIAYTIPSGYTHFNGLVGRDFAGCVCGDATVNFKVKLNGSVAFNSGAMGKNTNAQGFSIPLNGATQLELIVEPVNQNWGDVADWINPTLSQNASNSSGAPSPPTSVLANPATINVNASSLLTATCSQGTASWNNGAATGSPYTVSPTTTTTYDVKCVLGSNISSTQNVTVTVNGSGGSCAPVTNLAVMGTWNVAGGFQLVTRDFNGAKWLVQKTNINGSQYDEFTVRGSEMLQRSDVTLTNSTYNGLINCYAWQYSGYGGLVGPNANTTPAFPTPSGYNLYNAVDGTPYYSNYVSSTYSFANLSNDLFMGTWNVGSGYELRTKHFHNNKWVTQKININGSQYDEFVVRGSAMMQRSDVTLANSNFYNLTNCYPWQYSNYGNLAVPDASTFPTPAGYQKLLTTDQTPYFTNWSSGSRIGYVENQSVEEIPFLKVSPNPSSGLFKLDIHLDRDLIINIALTDAAGKVIKDKSVIGKKGVNSLEFDATSSPAGMYLFNVNDGINQEVKKVVIK